MSRAAKSGLTQAVADGLPEINAELAKASPERVMRKAAGVVAAVSAGVLALALLAGGIFVVWLFAASAIEQKQPLTIGLMVSLLLPLLPGFVLGIWATLRLDPDAGGAWTQFASVVGAMRKAVRPT